MYYLGMKPTADKRLYCTVLREAFNSLASGQLGTKLFGQQQINLSTLLALLPDSMFGCQVSTPTCKTICP
ncbi:hypothetical protein AMECASPLE_019121 [Ameca splendens]|uniref:Uncharacterized protein n=1 Tax=Ameca splendens TaxID=208324 RepID=A0ABV0Z0Z3_9TELE